MVLSRRDNPWVREHSKKSQTPTIVKKWKDSFPAPLAVLLFHECDIIKIEAAYHCDFIVLKVENGGLTETWIAFVYAYLEVTRQLEGYVCVCVLTRPPEEKDHWPIPPIEAGWHSSLSP